MKTFDLLTGVLVLVGALNWGLVGAANLDLVAAVFGMPFGELSAVTRVVYLLVGLSAVYQLVTLRAIRPAHA